MFFSGTQWKQPPMVTSVAEHGIGTTSPSGVNHNDEPTNRSVQERKEGSQNSLSGPKQDIRTDTICRAPAAEREHTCAPFSSPTTLQSMDARRTSVYTRGCVSTPVILFGLRTETLLCTNEHVMCKVTMMAYPATVSSANANRYSRYRCSRSKPVREHQHRWSMAKLG